MKFNSVYPGYDLHLGHIVYSEPDSEDTKPWFVFKRGIDLIEWQPHNGECFVHTVTEQRYITIPFLARDEEAVVSTYALLNLLWHDQFDQIEFDLNLMVLNFPQDILHMLDSRKNPTDKPYHDQVRYADL